MSKSTSGGGMSLLGVLQVIFIVLKLVNVIDWTWAQVLIPLWIELIIFALAIVYAWIGWWW